MVKVPEYQPSVSLRPALRQDIDVRATPEAFGTDIGKGLVNLGKGAMHLTEYVEQARDLEDVLRAKEADNKLADWDRNAKYGEGGYMTMEGRAAVDGRAAYEKQLGEKRREFGQGLTPGAVKAYETASQARMRSSLESAIVHSAGQRKKWFNDAGNARLETFANDALVNFNKPELANRNIAAGILELREQGTMHGWDAATLQSREADYVSGVRKNITLRIAQGDPVLAEKYMKENAGQLTGAHQYELQSKLETEIASEKSKREADAILGGARKPAEGSPGLTPFWKDGRAVPEAKPPGKTVADAGPTRTRAALYARLPAGKDRGHVDGLDENFATNLSAMLDDAPPGMREKLGIYSGYRSEERQRQLWENSDKSGKWVAPPGRSFHNHGQAVDLAYDGQSLRHAPPEVQKWVHDNAGKYGMFFPMKHEPWHIEPVGTRGGGESGTVAPRNNTVSPRAALPSYADIEARLQAIPDDKVRDLTRKRVYAGIEAQTKAVAQQEVAAKAELWKYIDQGQTPDSVPMEVRQAAGMAAVSSAWGYIETVRKGRAVENDESLLYGMRRYAASNPTEFADVDLNDYRDRLSKEAIKELSGKQTDALGDQRKAREEGITLTSAFSFAKQQLDAVGISTTGKKGAAAQREEARIAQFQNVLASEMEEFKRQNKRVPDQVEIQKLINKLLLPVVIKTPGLLWDSNDTGKRLFEAGARPDAAKVDIDVKYADIPIDMRRGISLRLETKNGRKPSEKEIADEYERFVLGASSSPAPDR